MRMLRRDIAIVPARWWRASSLVIVLGLLTACATAGAAQEHQAASTSEALASIENGRAAIQRYGCGACHTIPGVPGAQGTVAPTLAEYGRRTAIVGLAPNTTETLVRWLQDPSDVRPGSTMPNVGVTYDDARAIAAYLLSLQ